MTSYEFLREVAIESGNSLTATRTFMRGLEAVVEKHITDLEGFTLCSGIKMGSKLTSEHKYTNPRTGEICVAPKRRVPYCRFGNKYKGIVKEYNKTNPVE